MVAELNIESSDLLSDLETASILNITLQRLYDICSEFDKYPDDDWELNEGEHFEWKSKNLETRLFYEEGAMAIAKYLQEIETAGIVANFIDTVKELFTHRRKRTRKILVRRRIIHEFQSLTDDIIVQNNLVFLSRPRIIRILRTNGKGLNAAFKREMENPSLDGREQMEIGVHFDKIVEKELNGEKKKYPQYLSERGIARLALNMSENLKQKHRRAWTDAVAEVVENSIQEQKIYLESFDLRVDKAKAKVKKNANKQCQVSLTRQKPYDSFELHAHHLFDKSTRPDLADIEENLLAMRKEIHDGFHAIYGRGQCQPKDFIEYLSTIEAWRFDTPKMETHLQRLIMRLEQLQQNYENHRRWS